MSRLTTKIGNKVILPTIPMEIKSKEDLEEWHNIRREYEAMVIKLAEYEDREEQPQGITLKNINLTGISKMEQFKKVKEEFLELNNALIEDEYYADVEGDKTKLRWHIIEEFWDVVQSHLGLLEKHGISAEEVMKEYPKHLEKLKSRPRHKEE